MSGALGQTSVSRARWVAERVPAFVDYFESLTLEQLEVCVHRHDESLRTQDAQMTGRLKDDLEALTDHASHMRTIGANLILLKGGLLPALKVDELNGKLRAFAAQSLALLKAQYDFMETQLL